MVVGAHGNYPQTCTPFAVTASLAGSDHITSVSERASAFLQDMEASSTPAGSALATPPRCWAALGHSIRLDDAMLLLGIGSFGVVLSACVKAQQGLSVLTAAPADPSSEGERVALKLIVGSQPHVTASARHERDTLAALPAHDNIVPNPSPTSNPSANPDPNPSPNPDPSPNPHPSPNPNANPNPSLNPNHNPNQVRLISCEELSGADERAQATSRP